MKPTEKRVERYEPPCVDALDIACEEGFAASVDTPHHYDSNPSMGYGDEGEEWF